MIADQVATLDALSDGLAETAELEARIGELFTERGPAIMCSTVHRAKGLEAERVFVLTDTLYCNGKRQNEEESNIHYVALTRAKSTLVLVSDKGGV
jgi:superfamily I DNA/RNA helicase